MLQDNGTVIQTKAKPPTRSGRQVCDRPRPEGTVLERPEEPAEGGVFDEDAVGVLVAAFEGAWQAALKSGASVPSSGHVDAMRELLALRIIEVARSTGARDPVYLREDALLYLRQSTRKSTGC
jgi:hypothetical protein